MSLLRELITSGLGGLPRQVAALLPSDAILEAQRLAFVAGPILPLHGAKGARAYLANPGQADFTARAAEALGDERVRAFLDGPPGRRMIDTDGAHARLYQDDLHLEQGGDRVARTLDLHTGQEGELVRVGPLEARWRALREEAEAHGLHGLWLVHRTGPAVDFLLVVNEDRWTRTPEPAARALDALGNAAWLAARARAAAAGLAAYPDAVEIRPEGWWVTVGLFDPERPARRA